MSIFINFINKTKPQTIPHAITIIGFETSAYSDNVHKCVTSFETETGCYAIMHAPLAVIDDFLESLHD